MSRNWIREIKLTVSGESGGIDVSNMRIRFEIKDATIQTPRTADITISNLKPETAKRVLNEFTKVKLEAGYTGNTGQLFEGEIRQTRIGRETPTDTYCRILATNQNRAYIYAVVNKTLPAGSSAQDVYDAAVEVMKPYGVKPGFTPDKFKQFKFPRPIPLYGMARDVLRTLSHTMGCTWNIQNAGDKLNMVEKDGNLPGQIVVLNARTGMIGQPVQTQSGIMVRALINPQISVDTRIKLDNASIQRAGLNVSYGGEAFNAEPYLPSIVPDGVYRVVALDHVGDTRGRDWYCDMSCVGASNAATKSQIALGRS